MSALLAVVTIFSVRPARSAPGDIFSMPAPAVGADPPKGADIKTGDLSVATQTGGASYSYPIAVPPGRLGMAPQLALHYSAQAPIYGGIAAGWSLDIPVITEDFSVGRLRTRSAQADQIGSPGGNPYSGGGVVGGNTGEIDVAGDDTFVSSLAGGRPLVGTGEPVPDGVYTTYRAQNDTTFARYQRMHVGQPYRWRVLMTDGSTWYFGETARTVNCVGVSDQYAPLTRVEDAFGNAIDYQYEATSTGECRLLRIRWGHNTHAPAGSPLSLSFAQVSFNWEETLACVGNPPGGLGGQSDYRTGQKIVTGASSLRAIRVIAYEPTASQVPTAIHTRSYTLGYGDTLRCDAIAASPYRTLTSIQESAFGVDAQRVDLPPVTFEYAPVPRLIQPATPPQLPWHAGTGTEQFTPARNFAWGYRHLTDASGEDRWPTVEAMMVDIDGDGLTDRLFNPDADSTSNTDPVNCHAKWQRNLGPDANGNPRFETVGQARDIALPRLKWRGTDSFTTQLVAGGAHAYRGAPSLEGCSLNGQVTAYSNSGDPPSNTTAPCHAAGTTCTQGAPHTADQYCGPEGTECPADALKNASSNFRTYLNYRWLDVTGDGLVDLVASIYGNVNVYDVERGNDFRLDPSGDVYTRGEPPLPGIPGAGEWPACDGDPGLNQCQKFSTNGQTVGSMACGNLTSARRASSPCETPGCEAGRGQQPASQVKEPYSRCQGRYPWLIYKNLGNGNFAPAPLIKYQPVPLESDQGDSSFNGPSVTAVHHSVMDFDGDGFLDVLGHDAFNTGNNTRWQVWLGDGTGGFFDQFFTISTRPSSPQALNANAFTGFGGPTGTVEISRGILDINGDGAVDQWVTPDGADYSSIGANITLNDGAKMRLSSSSPSPYAAGEVNTPVNIRLGDTSVAEYPPGTPPQGPFYTGTTRAARRTYDIDFDGRPDVVTLGATAAVYHNVGGTFAAATSYPHAYDESLDGIRRRNQGIDVFGLHDVLHWEQLSDLIDLDGNGIPEDWSFDDARVMSRWRETPTGPPRLLMAVNNGHGLRTTIQYAAMHENESTDPTVIQHPDQYWTDVLCLQRLLDGCPKSNPHTGWVVRSTTTHDTFANTDTTTNYRYESPRFGPDDKNHFAFRGFELVTTIGPTGARTLERYGFDIDWSGRLVSTIVKPSAAEGVNDVRSISDTTYQRRSLFLNTVVTYHPTQTRSYTCANGQTEAACRVAPAGFVQTDTEWQALLSVTGFSDPYPLLWTESVVWRRTGTSLLDGDRATTTSFVLYAEPDAYRLRPNETIDTVWENGGLRTYRKSARHWDSNYLAKLSDEVWFDAEHSATTAYTTNLLTGNVESRIKPEQYLRGASASATHYVFDARGLFVAQETNELGHEIDDTWEYGTGTKVQTDGPNTRTCDGSCVTDDLHPVKQRSRIKIDGLGRTLEDWETFGDSGSEYTLTQTATHLYYQGNGVDRDYVLNSRRLDADETPDPVDGSTTWIIDKGAYDGHGRLLTQTVMTQGSAPADQVTSYQYDAAGRLTSVRVPDPSLNNTSTVAYTYTFDSLSRPTGIRRPDASTSSDQSGVDMAYDGLIATTTEVVGAAGGVSASTQTVNDSFGRLVRVKERLDDGSWAVTKYSFGPNDTVEKIIDPENATTKLEHDFADRRVRITRGTRVWKYRYDDNGNLRSERVPGGSDALDAGDFTTTFAYDDLDRVRSKSLGRRALSDGDLALFGASTEKYTWDDGANGIGQLRKWRSFGPDGTTPVLETNHDHDAQGHEIKLGHTATFAGLPTLSREMKHSFYTFGGEKKTQYGDFFDEGTQQTKSFTKYDARGLPQKISVTRDDSGREAIAKQDRNVAGLVLTRKATPEDGPLDLVKSVWSYDSLGRVLSQNVVRNLGAGPELVVKQELQYFGNDDPQFLHHWLGETNHKKFKFTYDARHQLVRAQETLQDAFDGRYAFGAAGRFLSAKTSAAALPGGGVVPRDVAYAYQGDDPEEVTALVHGSTTTASYTYDAAGNQVTRSYPATNEDYEYQYDGKDQLRRVVRRASNAVVGTEEYWYDADGARSDVLKRDASGTKTELIAFLEYIEAHYDGTGADTKVYSHISIGTPLARVERTGSALIDTSLEYQFHGLANNTLAAVGQDGTINASFAYAPFGELLEATNGGGSASGLSAHKRRSNDKYEDDVSSLAYYGARYYDKTLIGWTQGDPLFRFAPDSAWTEPRRANLYVYSRQNPLRYVDPDGRDGLEGTMDGLSNSMPDARLAAMVKLAAVAVVVTAIAGERIADAAKRTMEQVKDAFTRVTLTPFPAELDRTAQFPVDKTGNSQTSNGSPDTTYGPPSSTTGGRETLDQTRGSADTSKPLEARQDKWRGKATSPPCDTCGKPNSGNVDNKKDGTQDCADCFTKSNKRRPTGVDYIPSEAGDTGDTSSRGSDAGETRE